MERINKATLFVNLLFFGTKKEEIYKNRLRLGVAVLFLEYTFVYPMKRSSLAYLFAFLLFLDFFKWLFFFRIRIANIRSGGEYGE